MKKISIMGAFLCFLSLACADQNEYQNLDNEFWNFVTTLMSGIQQPGSSGITTLIGQLLHMGFDQDSPGIEMLELIAHDMEQEERADAPVEQKLVADLKQQFAQKLAITYLKIEYITQKTDFSESSKARLIRDEIQEFFDYCLPGLRLPENTELFDLKEFLQINKSVKVSDYKARIYALVALVRGYADERGCQAV